MPKDASTSLAVETTGASEREDALFVQECVSGIIEIDVLEIEMRDQRVAIPKRAIQLRAAIQPARQLFDGQRLPIMRSIFPPSRQKDRAVSFRTRVSKKLLDARPHIPVAAIRTTILECEAHKMRSIDVVISLSSAI